MTRSLRTLTKREITGRKSINRIAYTDSTRDKNKSSSIIIYEFKKVLRSIEKNVTKSTERRRGAPDALTWKEARKLDN